MLLLHRRMPAAAVIAGITAALDAGAANPQLVAIEARNAAAATDSSGDTRVTPVGPDDTADSGLGAVLTLPGRRAPVPDDTRPLPSVDIYDRLLTHRTRKGAL